MLCPQLDAGNNLVSMAVSNQLAAFNNNNEDETMLFNLIFTIAFFTAGLELCLYSQELPMKYHLVSLVFNYIGYSTMLGSVYSFIFTKEEL